MALYLRFFITPENCQTAERHLKPPSRGQKQNQVLWAWMVYFCAPGAVMETSFVVRSMQDEIAFISYEV